MREYVWQAWKFQKAIDLCPCGGLNYSGIEALRTIEELKKWEQGSMPSFQTVRRACLLLETHASQDFGLDVHVAESENGKVHYFDPAILLRLIVESHNMVHIAATGSEEKPMLLNVTLDAALL